MTFYHQGKCKPMQMRKMVFGITILALWTSCNMQNDRANQENNLEQKANQISDPDLFFGKNKAKLIVENYEAIKQFAEEEK